MVMGHEFSGVVTAMGAGTSGPEIGTHVTVFPLLFCGTCDMCKSDRVNICTNKRFLGVFNEPGALAEYICVPARYAIPLAPEVPFRYGAIVEPLAVGYHAVKLAGPLSNKTVIIIGAGAIGLMLLKWINEENPAHVVMSDVNESRLAIARKMGAETINPLQQESTKRLKELIGPFGADITLEAVGGSATVGQSISFLKNGGTTVWVGNAAKTVEIPMQEVVTRELTIQGSHVYTYQEFAQIARRLPASDPELEQLISKVCSLEEAPVYFEKMLHNPENLVKVVVEVSREA